MALAVSASQRSVGLAPWVVPDQLPLPGRPLGLEHFFIVFEVRQCTPDDLQEVLQHLSDDSRMKLLDVAGLWTFGAGNLGAKALGKDSGPKEVASWCLDISLKP